MTSCRATRSCNEKEIGLLTARARPSHRCQTACHWAAALESAFVQRRMLSPGHEAYPQCAWLAAPLARV